VTCPQCHGIPIKILHIICIELIKLKVNILIKFSYFILVFTLLHHFRILISAWIYYKFHFIRKEGGGADTKKQGLEIFFFFFEIFFLKKNFFKKDFDKEKKEKGKPSFINLNYVKHKNV